MKTANSWLITGTRSNGEVLYYVSNATQGASFVPNAQSIAYRWFKRDVALCEVANMARLYKGLVIGLEQTTPAAERRER